MILFDGKIKKNIPNEKIKCLKFLKKIKICCVYVKMSVSKSVNVSAFLVWHIFRICRGCEASDSDSGVNAIICHNN